ncbi:MAG: Uma2 family endonuclease, partial [Bacteroidota bacterium]
MNASLEKKWTWQEFRNLEFEEVEHTIYELFNGTIVKRTIPSLTHQRVSRHLTFFLGNFLLENPLGEFFEAPTDVALGGESGVVPDISYVSAARSHICEGDDYINGTPDLIMEIISPGYIRRDRVEKKELYEKYAVKEYWIIDPYTKSVEIYVMRDDRYAEHQFLE